MSGSRPSYAALEQREGFPPGSSWGLYGSEDEVGAINDLSAAHVVNAAGLVRRGQVFSLNWELTKPHPPLFSRGPVHHVVEDHGFGTDDHYDAFFPQASSQWDALSHFRHPRWGYYNGRNISDVIGAQPRNGIDNWARRGIAARYLLADVARWRAERGRHVRCDRRDVVPMIEVAAALTAKGASPQLGDVLLIRFGWTAWYDGLSDREREDLGARPDEEFEAPGLAADRETMAWLWDSGFVGVGCDCPAVEAFPFDPLAETGVTLHGDGLALLGLALGEMFDLERLAHACAEDGEIAGLLTAAPLNMPGGSGSPANVLALR